MDHKKVDNKDKAQVQGKSSSLNQSNHSDLVIDCNDQIHGKQTERSVIDLTPYDQGSDFKLNHITENKKSDMSKDCKRKIGMDKTSNGQHPKLQLPRPHDLTKLNSHFQR